MQFLLCILLGCVVGLAFASPMRLKALSWTLFGVTIVGACLPHIDFFLRWAPQSYQMMYNNSLSWSLLFGPLMALLSASVFSALFGKPLKILVLPAIFAFGCSLLMALITTRGVQLFSPFSSWPFALNIMNPFDWGVFGILSTTCLMALFFRSWLRYVGYIGLVSIMVYIGFLMSFMNDARMFGSQYASSFGLDVRKVHTLPQPLSPANWRVIVETSDGKLHDTLVNVRRQSEKVLDVDPTRAARIDALYKPRHLAIWRVYRRFGYQNPTFAKGAWMSLARGNRHFTHLSRFWVAEEMLKVNSHECVQFADLLKEGSRAAQKHKSLICKEDGSAVLYKSDGKGYFSKLLLMY